VIPVILLGHTGNYGDMVDTVEDINDAEGRRYEIIGILTAREGVQTGQLFYGYPVIGRYEDAHRYPHASFLTTTGGGVSAYHLRERVLSRLGIARERFLTLVHPTSYVSRRAKLGQGVIVFQNCTITNNVTLGDHVLVLPNTVVSHDDVVGDYSIITGNVAVSGLVTIGRSCYIGTNASIHHAVKIGDGCLVGMGSVVRHDVPDYQVVVGNPARVLRDAARPE
jgi:sugar O-acyltransferase (sialic acid O-acetyltransferase NeuD family)